LTEYLNEERRRFGLFTKADCEPAPLTKELNEAYINRGIRTIYVEPSNGGQTNPLFAKAQPDSVRLGQRKFVAKILVQQANPNWKYCVTHCVVCSWQGLGRGAGWHDWIGDVHGDPHNPLSQCVMTDIRTEDIASMDEKIGEMFTAMKGTAEQLDEAITDKRNIEETKRRKRTLGEGHMTHIRIEE
jgi:hypothetical protein